MEEKEEAWFESTIEYEMVNHFRLENDHDEKYENILPYVGKRISVFVFIFVSVAPLCPRSS